jgi:protein gp37
VSAACDHCYAEAMAHRLGLGLWGDGSERRLFGDKHWRQPERWDRKAGEAGVRRRVFCASMADVFEDRRDLDGSRARLWDLAERTANLDWLLLTKRPENVAGMVPLGWRVPGGWPRNVWLGTTVENQRRANERLPILVGYRAPVRFVSAEPLLGPVDMRAWLARPDRPRGVDWVLVGGESGAKARRMAPEWALSLAEQCDEAGAAFHFKQAGRVLGGEWGCADGHGGDDSAFPEWARRREVPAVQP